RFPGTPGAGGDAREADRRAARFHHEAAGGEMIGKRIVHDIARAEARGEERARRAPKILARALRLEDRPRRHQQSPQATCRRHVEAAERRGPPLARPGRRVVRPPPPGRRPPPGDAPGGDARALRGAPPPAPPPPRPPP